MLKRLDLMNRDQSRIILIDDSEKASSLFPRNTLLVKPYVDTTDQSDTALLDLIPLLQAFIHDQSTDFRDTIDDLGTYCTYIDTDINIYHPYQIMDNTMIIFCSTLPIISLPFALLYFRLGWIILDKIRLHYTVLYHIMLYHIILYYIIFS